ESYVGRFDLPLLVDPRMPLKKLNKLIGIKTTFDESLIADVVKIPTEPYAIWTHDGSRYRQYSVRDALHHFEPDEAPCVLMEVTHLFVQYPELFSQYGVDASGSFYGGD